MPVMPRGPSLYWTGINKAKRSIANFGAPEGGELVEALVGAPEAEGGIFLTNTASAWLTREKLAERRGDLISCTIQGNGDGATAVDYTVNCAAGFPEITGSGSSEAPGNHVLPAWDIACANHAVFALASAIDRLRQPGVGAELRQTLFDFAFSTLANLGMLAEADLLDQERRSTGNYLYGVFGRDFATRDGNRVFVAAVPLGLRKRLVDVTGTAETLSATATELGPDFTLDEYRFSARERIAAVREAGFSERTVDEAGRALDSTSACSGRSQSVRQALRQDPRLSDANPIFSRLETPGIGRQVNVIVRERGVASGVKKPAPILGEHTAEILSKALGLAANHVKRLHDEGVVAGAERDPVMSQKDRLLAHGFVRSRPSCRLVGRTPRIAARPKRPRKRPSAAGRGQCLVSQSLQRLLPLFDAERSRIQPMVLPRCYTRPVLSLKARCVEAECVAMGVRGKCNRLPSRSAEPQPSTQT
jgi:2-methylfumaryl-CoA isomerase